MTWALGTIYGLTNRLHIDYMFDQIRYDDLLQQDKILARRILAVYARVDNGDKILFVEVGRLNRKRFQISVELAKLEEMKELEAELEEIWLGLSYIMA